MRIGLLLSLFIAPFFPLFFVLKNSTDDRSLIHRLIAVGFVVHWLFIPVNFTDEPLALQWVLAAASWILVHKATLWLFTDFQLFRNNIFKKYKYNSNRQIWEYLKATLLCPLTGIPEEWIPDSERKPIKVDETAKTEAKIWVLPKSGPSITINFVRFILCTLLGSLAREIPPSELDPSFFTITSIKTNFFLITFIYGYISTGWDLWFIFIRSVISTGTKLYNKRYPRSPLLRSNPQPDTTPFYLQDFLTIMTKYHPLFNNPYTFRSLKYFWAKQWHQVFSVAFVDCCYRKVHHPGCHPFRTFLALYTAFINSGILHEFLLCSTHGAASVSFEDFLFMSLQPPVLMIEYFVFKTVVARNKLLRAAFWLIEYYYLIGIMSLFWRPFIRNSTYQAQVFVFNVWRWEEHTATAIVVEYIRSWLKSNQIVHL